MAWVESRSRDWDLLYIAFFLCHSFFFWVNIILSFNSMAIDFKCIYDLLFKLKHDFSLHSFLRIRKFSPLFKYFFTHNSVGFIFYDVSYLLNMWNNISYVIIDLNEKKQIYLNFIDDLIKNLLFWYSLFMAQINIVQHHQM